jgi:hypothetical protein
MVFQTIDDYDKNGRRHSILLADNPLSLFTMRQFNSVYLSSYRPWCVLPMKPWRKCRSDCAWCGSCCLFMPLTHEEGHRSILTSLGIGSISKPYFNSDGAAYVTGVTDATLSNLRDSSLPDYIRLHTAGLESDYCLNKRAEILAFSGQEEKNVLLLKSGQKSRYYFLASAHSCPR